MPLSLRQICVLEAIITDYIATGEPVGSRTISKKYDLGVSSATIRNEMADLEELGYIFQPHASAGRVPSDGGYRYYVDYVLPKKLAEESHADERLFDLFLDGGRANDEATRHALLSLLAKESRYAAMLFLPEPNEEEAPVLAVLNLLYLAPGRALMVIVTDDEQVENELIDIPMSLDEGDLTVVDGLLNHYLRGLPAHYWAEPLASFLQSQEGRYAHIIMDVVRRLGKALAKDNQTRTYLEGVLNLLDQPEFQDIEKMRTVLSLLTEPNAVFRLMASVRDGLTVTIGSENTLPEAEELSLMTHSYRVGKQVAHLGLLGPKRMNYIACARLLNEAVNAIEEAFGPQYMLVPERQSELAPLLHSFAWRLRDLR